MARVWWVRQQCTFALVALCCAFACGPGNAAQHSIPESVVDTLRAARIPTEDVALIVQETGEQSPLLDHGMDRPMNPASVMKLLTTFV
ncbi:MAG: D-alanyl-D-alanine carboxypeptidase, partial [Burkholderiales bacterium]